MSKNGNNLTSYLIYNIVSSSNHRLLNKQNLSYSYNLSCNLLLQHKCKCYGKEMIAKVQKLLRKTSMMKFLLVKFASLQRSDCNFAIKRTHHRLFLEYVQKTSCLKKNKKRKSLFFRKKSIVDHRLSCSPVVNKLQILPKSRARVRSSCRNAERSNIFTGKPPWWRLFKFSAYLCNFIKRITPQRFCYMSTAW